MVNHLVETEQRMPAPRDADAETELVAALEETIPR